MKVPINWLKQYIDVKDEKELLEKLTSIGHMQDGPPKTIEGINVYDLEIRQNRPDCLSLLGIAQETAAVFNSKVKYPEEYNKELPAVKKDTKVSIQDPNLCYRFNTVTIEGVKVASSPAWIKKRLSSYGIKTINNIVDITNYVMIELGQPLHAWDADKVEGHSVILRIAKKEEKVKVLGGKEITLSPQDLVAADSKKILSVAGIIGAEDSGISDETTSIILEDATYNQASIRKSSLRHAIRTESSTRHEKFLHPQSAELGLRRATWLILELAGGKVVDHTDIYSKKVPSKEVVLSMKKLNLLGGVEFIEKEVEDILTRLGLPFKKSASQYSISIPFYRTDIELEEDLIEEVLRINGYDKIPALLPQSAPPSPIEPHDILLEDNIRDLLVGAGYDEQITEPLTQEVSPKNIPIALQNSLNADKTMLRTSLKLSLYQALQEQAKYREDKIQLFELGKIYYRFPHHSDPDGSSGEESFKEEKMLGVITSGLSYFEIKGVIELLKDRFVIDFDEEQIQIEAVDEEIYFFEIVQSKIKKIKNIKPFQEPPHFVLEDLSIVVPKNTHIGKLIKEVQSMSTLLSNVMLGEDPQLKGEGKTVFLKLEFSRSKKNLTKDDVAPERKKIVKLLQEKYNATIRSSI